MTFPGWENRAYYTAFGDANTPELIMRAIVRYEKLYEVRQVPKNMSGLLGMLRRETGWPIVMSRTGLKRIVVVPLSSKTQPQGKTPDD